MFKKIISGVAISIAFCIMPAFSADIKVDYGEIDKRVTDYSSQYMSNKYKYEDSIASSPLVPQDWNVLEYKRLNYEIQKNNLFCSVKSKFIRYKKTLNEEEQQLNNYNIQLKRTTVVQKKYKLGLVKKSDVEDSEDALEDSYDAYLNIQDKRKMELGDLKFHLGISKDDNLVLGKFPDFDKRTAENINLSQFINSVINNQKQIDILYYSSIGSSSYHYDKLIRENDVGISVTQKYLSVKNSLKVLEKSEKKLTRLTDKLKVAQKKYDKGLISKQSLKESEIRLSNQVLTLESDRLSLLDEYEGLNQLNY